MAGNRVEIVNRQHLAVTEIFKFGRIAMAQLRAIIKLQQHTIVTGKVGAGIEQMRLAGSLTTP
jgi:hypothetical protein